ncbi:MAG: phosphatidate cytidylyltransferase [Candidatus Pacebacteria bacterium]|nr:phosphatidate cytidylyltransferase [Candidatus Paceibacterota bacterium]
MPTKEQPYLPQTNPELFQVESTLIDFSQVIKDHFGETSMVMMYGSAAFEQLGYSEEDIRSSKLDCIIAVPDIKKWQVKHGQRHPEDFPMIAHLIGPNLRSKMQGKKTWFIHTELPIQDGKYQRKIKVGIIEQASLVNDLSNWDQFYIAGRMQKPTYIAESDQEIQHALYYQTMKQGLHLALLQSIGGQPLKLRDLYITLSNLSYTGDTRMKFAEDPNKVANIVDANKWRYDLMYMSLIKEAESQGLLITQSDQIIPFPWLENHDLLIKTISQLPLNIIAVLPENWRELEYQQLISLVNKKLEETVKSSSVAQTIFGLLMVSPTTGINYVARKLKKARKK